MSSSVTSPRMDPLKPIFTAHLFPKLDGMLLELLPSLAPEDWEKQTVSSKWKVKDVAAHLLDTALRGISIGRDAVFLLVFAALPRTRRGRRSHLVEITHAFGSGSSLTAVIYFAGALLRGL
jgi:hypothetical protein